MSIEIFIPNILTKAEVYAFKALEKGVANERQQQIIFLALQRSICDVQGIAFEPNNPQMTAFNEGKRAVAITITKAVQFDWDAYEAKTESLPKRKPAITNPNNN